MRATEYIQSIYATENILPLIHTRSSPAMKRIPINQYVRKSMQAMEIMSQKKYLTGIFVFNLVLAWTLFFVTSLNRKDLGFFTYHMTKRSAVNDFEGISDLITGWGVSKDKLSENLAYPLNETGRVLLRSEVFDKAKCFAVSYSGNQQWRAGDVSPMCNCLDNMITMFTMAHVNNNMSQIIQLEKIDRSVLANMSNATETKFMKNLIEKECFNGVRATQVESMYSNEFYLSVNIVMSAMVWNTLSLLTSFCIMWQSLSEQNNNQSMEMTGFALYGVQILFFIFTHLPLCVLAGYLSTNQPENQWITITTTIFIVFFDALVTWMMVIGNEMDKSAKKVLPGGSWQFRKVIVFWYAYVTTLPFLLGSFNALTQKRDEFYNIITMFLIICVGLCFMCEDFVRYKQTHKNTNTQNTNTQKHKKRLMSVIRFVCVQAPPPSPK